MKPALRCLTLLLLLAVGISGCMFMPQITPVDDSERESILAFTEPIADSIFAGLNQGDYAAFSQDFDDPMRKALTEKSFTEMSASFSQSIGAYQSRTVKSLKRVDEVILVEYDAVFEKENSVSIQLSVSERGEHYVTGLWFDSPKLREQQ